MAAPIFTGLDNNPAFTEGGSFVTLDNNATVTNSNVIDGVTLTLARSGGANADDLYDSAYFSESEVTSPFSSLVVASAVNSAGTLIITFNSDATSADLDAVLQSLTYADASNAPPPSVTIQYVYNNGQQATGSITIGITPVDTAPTVDGTAPAYYPPGGAAVVLSPGILLADPDNATLAGATVSLNAHDVTDLLSANVGATGITQSYDASTGILTLTGSASVEAYRQVLASVTYSSSATEPMSFGVPRTVTWHVSDGTLAGEQASSLDFAPVLDLDQSGAGTGFATAFTQGGGAVAVVDTDDHIAKAGTDLVSATVVLTNAKPGDVLSVTGSTAHITFDESVANQITLTSDGSATPADFQAALRQIVFNNTDSVVNPATRDVTVVVQDFNNSSNTAHTAITVNATNHPGSATNDTATATEDTVLSVAAPGVLANDSDPDGLVVITGTTSTSHGGTIQFASDGSYAYTPPADFSGADSVSYTAQDPFGSQVSATLNITVNAVNDPPVFAHFGTNHTSVTEQTFGLLNNQATVSDVELDAANGGAGNYAGASLIIGRGGSPNPNPDDTFSFSTTGATFTVDTVNHVLRSGGFQFATYSIPSSGSLNGTISVNFNSLNTPATTALVNNVLEHISYKNLSDTPPASVTMHYTFNDGNAGSQGSGGIGTDTANRIVDITPVNDAPVAQDGSASGESTVTGTLSATDVDSASLGYALVVQAAHGAVTVNANGTFTYTASSGYSGADSFTFKANDGGLDSNVATESLTVTQPSGGGGGGGPTFTGTPGDDSFTALSGNERIDAGTGIDTITFGFKLVDATVTYSGNQVIIDGPGSHTVLTGFEIYKFTDGTVNNNDSDPLVDDLYYYSQYHDVWNAHADADQHYHQYGWHEGRNPDAFFNTTIYLSANPDVKAAGVDPLLHFDQSGWKEGRVPSITFDPRQYLNANPDVKAANVDPLAHFLQNGAQEGRQPFAPTELIASNGFDYVYYLQHNPDVAAAGVDPFQHYETTGWKEGRNPDALFDVNGYLAAYPDVKAAGINPLDHYNQFGWHEGRDPSVGFDTTDYLSHYADVAAANINPLAHFLHFGIHEGRSPFADGHFG